MEADAAGEKGIFPRRLNLIFHGLMAFWDAPDEKYDVLIPRGKDGDVCHEARYGNPLHRPDWHHDLGGATGTSPKRYTITGIKDHTLEQPKQNEVMILHQNQLKPYDLDLTHIRAIITVPKPEKILHFRQVDIRNHSLTNHDPRTMALLKKQPDSVPGVTVFSYSKFEDRPALEGEGIRYPIHFDWLSIPFWNLCVYSQPWDDQCKMEDSALFNRMFHFLGTTDSPKLNLNLENLAEVGPNSARPDTNITNWELLSLPELNGRLVALLEGQTLSRESPVPTASYGGCINGFVCGPNGST